MNRSLNGRLMGQPLVPSCASPKAARGSACKVYAREATRKRRDPPKRTSPNWRLEKKDRLVEGGNTIWYPGLEPPEYLDGCLPGDRGFDPLRLAEKFRIGEGPVEEKGTGLPWLYEAELANGRIAMLASAGIIAQDFLGHGPWFTAPQRTEFSLPYWPAVAAFHILWGAYEYSRWQNFKTKGETGFIQAPFDSIVKANDYRRQSEIRNARLAMVAQVGFWTQAWATGVDPVQNLADHLANPFANNILANPRGQQAFTWLICGGFSLLFLDAGNQAERTGSSTSDRQQQSQQQSQPKPAESGSES